MIINNSSVRRAADAESYIWNGLRGYRNIDRCSERIFDVQSAPMSQKRNVRKQAKQIGHCILLAGEYFEAARHTTLATSPLLYYYAIMNFALAEILLKQSGESSLDAARAQHRHHGLKFSVNGNLPVHDGLCAAAGSLMAKPVFDPAGLRIGTFELWHRSAREYPLVGKLSNAVSGSSGVDILLSANDERLPLVPVAGLSFLTILKFLPGLLEELARFGVNANLVRATCERRIKDGRQEVDIIVHPSDKDSIEGFGRQFLVESRSIENFTVHEYQSGYAVRATIKEGDNVRFVLPVGTSMSLRQTRFSSQVTSLNEFGLFYFGMFIIGNLCRYYPDLWMDNLRENSELSLIVEIFVQEFRMRVPMLVLSELDREFIVLDGQM